MRVLLIGQLPKEAGGNYTTGIARVVENLYQKDFGEGIELYWYFTNVTNKTAQQKNVYPNQYTGYKWLLLKMLVSIILHPCQTVNEWKKYRMSNVNPLRFEFYKANMNKVIKEVKPDLIHIHGGGVMPLFYANRRGKVPIVLTFHGVMYNKEDPNSWHFKPSYLEHIKMTDFFTVLNQETKRKALDLGMPSDRCAIIPNGVDTSRFYFSKEQRELLRAKYGVTGDCRVFITTGVVIDRKGQYDFMQLLDSLGIDYQYWIVGKGPDEHKIAYYVAEHHLESKVKMLGYVDGRELYKYLSAADFYAHVSTTEGQALSEIEAYATGLRVIVRKEIAGTVIGDPDKDTNSYYVLDMRHPEEKEIINWLLPTSDERQSRGKYDWSLIARKYGDFYRQIVP